MPIYTRGRRITIVGNSYILRRRPRRTLRESKGSSLAKTEVLLAKDSRRCRRVYNYIPYLLVLEGETLSTL